MARNDITGDSIANTKGNAEKYAQGWDAIFKPKKTGDESCWMEIGHFMVDDSHVIPMMVERNPQDDAVFEQMGWSKASFTKEAAHKAFAGLKRNNVVSIHQEGEPAKIPSCIDFDIPCSVMFYTHTDAAGNSSHKFGTVRYEKPEVVMALDFHDGATHAA